MVAGCRRHAAPARCRDRDVGRCRQLGLRGARGSGVRASQGPGPVAARAGLEASQHRPGSHGRRASRRSVRDPGHLAHAGRDRLLPAARRGDPGGLPRVRGRLEVQGRHRRGRDRWHQLLQAHRAVTGRRSCRKRACRSTRTSRSSPRPASSSGSARRWSTTTPTG